METATPIEYQRPSRPLPRILVGVAIVLLMWICQKVPGMLPIPMGTGFMFLMFSPMVGAVALVIWMLAFSRFPWSVRLGGMAALGAGAAVALAADHSMFPMGLLLFALPIALSAMVGWLLIFARSSPRVLIAGMIAVVVLVAGFFATLRVDGLKGDISAEISFRWSPTKEDKYLASRHVAKPIPASVAVTPPTTQPASISMSDWPEFRGSNRDGILHGVKLRTDWNTNPPALVWKHLIGPGWSSVCVVGDRLFTQEQRGEEEVVVCFSATTGEEIWSHSDQVRFHDDQAGAGPRATPTFADGMLYAFGARGTLNCLDPMTGKVIWSRDVMGENNAKLPIWGFSGSPLVHGGLVLVITGGEGKAVAAYDQKTGAPVWAKGDGWGYCSPQLASLGGVQQVLFVSDKGLASLDPTDGHQLWQNDFELGKMGGRCIQPAVIDGKDVLFGASFDSGTRRVQVEKSGDQWKQQTVWTCRKFNPYYNDMVYQDGYCYGFDNAFLACLDVNKGAVIWKARDYEHGQVLLIADQKLLLIQAESGFVALMDANPGDHNEIARFSALDDKTWNHPVVANGKLFVRNGKEIACYDVAAK